MISRTKKHWHVLVFVILVLLCLFFIGSKLGSPTNVQAQLQAAGNEQIMVVPIQLERDSFGLAMVDTFAETLWIYEINTHGPAHSRLKLLAARSFKYDRKLKQYNTAEPTPEQVRILLENLEKLKNKKIKQDSDRNIPETTKPSSK